MSDDNNTSTFTTPSDATGRPQTHGTTDDSTDHSAYIKRAQRALTHDSHCGVWLANHSISMQTARTLGLGYDPRTNELIIPTLYGGYIAHNVDTDAERATDDGPVFTDALQDGTDPVFVVDSWHDALAVAQAGGPRVVALNGADVTPLIAHMERIGDIPPIMAEINNAADIALGDYLRTRDVPYDYASITVIDRKDGLLPPSESIVLEGTRLRESVAWALETMDDRLHPGKKYDANNFAGYDVCRERFEHCWMHTLKTGTPRIPTGIEQLDAQLGGGLFPGFFTLGGMTGAGKTTLALQIADNIAASGRPVLYVALEMSTAELYAKSLARIAYDIGTDKGNLHAPSYGEIMEGALHKLTWGMEVVQRYARTIAGNMIIHEAVGHTPWQRVREQVDMATHARGTAPFVVVDYLQIMGAEDPHMSDKQAADANVLGLKQISRDYNTPVLVLSSLNRANYDGPLKMSAYKESGGIEYTADILLGLECTGSYDQYGGRPVQVSLLKNRRGLLREPTGYSFHGGACLLTPYAAAVRPDNQHKDDGDNLDGLPY